ncbi:MAG: ABC transporter permease, partial [Sarcina sp.]
MKSEMNDAHKQINIGLVDSKDSNVKPLLQQKKNIKIVENSDLEKELKDGKISLIVKVPEDFSRDLLQEKISNLKIVYDNTSSKSQIACNEVKNIFENYYKEVVNERIESKGLSKSLITPFSITEEAFNNKKDSGIGLALLNMLPSLLMIFLISPTVSIAADLGAGEKERGTLEPLLSTSCNRGAILWGKVTSICVVSLVALAVSMAAMGISAAFVLKVGMSVSITYKTLLIIALFSILVLVSISALEIVISIYARSMKEANSYLGGLTIPLMFLCYIPFMMDGKNLKFMYFNIPVVNAIAVMKEAIVGIYNVKHIIIVIAWHVLYMILS